MKINIYHTNDIHSNYDFLKKVNKYIRENKTENDIYLDSGDFLDLSSIVVEANPKNAMKLIMESGLDCMTIGNGELDLVKDKLEKLLDNNYPIISCNVLDIDNNSLRSLRTSIIIERLGIRFLILGVAPYFNNEMTGSSYNKFFNLSGMQSINPFSALRYEIDSNRGKYDYIILLSHSGHIVDPVIMEKFPEINLVLAAHTHIIISKDNYTMSGRGECLGKITIEISENEDKNIKNINNEQIFLQEEENKEFDNLISEVYQDSYNILSEEITLLDKLDFNPFFENRLINFLCDALYKHYKVDFALINNGIASKGLDNLTSKREILEAFPSKLNPTIFNIKGELIRKAISKSFDDKYIHQDGKGAGFRGNVLGALSFSYNVKIIKSDKEIFVDGMKLDDNRIYSLISSDYLQRGTGYTDFKNSQEEFIDKYFFKEFIQLYLDDKSLFESSKLKRIN